MAKSVLNVMAAGIKCGTEINLICDGEDEEAAMEALSAAIESGLGEEIIPFYMGVKVCAKRRTLLLYRRRKSL